MSGKPTRTPADPAVLRLIKTVCDAAIQEEIGLNVCGEMSGEVMFAPLLVGYGFEIEGRYRGLPDLHLLNTLCPESGRKRNGPDLTNIIRDLISLHPITPGSASYQEIIFINERNTGTVKLRFHTIFDLRQSGQFTGLPVKILQVLRIVGIIQ